MRDQQGGEVGKFKSVSSDFEPYKQDTIVAYWDTEGVDSGEYDATITINYEDGKKTEKQFKADVSLDSIKLSLIGATARVVGSDNGLTGGSLLALLVVVLIVINVAWFIYFRRKLRSKR
mgnify:CR=1 FL=1